MSEQKQRTPLSQEIQLLGNLLGMIIREQHGSTAFDLVEDVRDAAKLRRNNHHDAAAVQLEHLIRDTDLEQKQILTKAFSNYFQLINIAEDRQRIRTLHQRELRGELRESIDEAIKTLYESGKSAAEVQEILNTARLRFVLTAHPSEAKRKEVLIKLHQVSDLMAVRERKELLAREERDLQNHLAAEIEELWQTRPIRALQKTVADEVDFGIYFVRSVIMDVSIDIYEDLQASLESYYPDADWSDPPAILRYASWIGGDRDGNPNVTTDVTLQTLKTLRQAALETYLNEVASLRDHLTQSTDDFGITDVLKETIRSVRSSQDYPGEMYRQQMDIIWHKLAEDEYRSSRDLLADLLMVEESLCLHGGTRVAQGILKRLIRKVRLFGLHLLPLEIREDARLHAAALDELFRYYGRCPKYLDLSEADKQQLLTDEIANPRPLFPLSAPRLSETTHQIMATWRMIENVHQMYDPIVIDTVIASMCQQPSDVLAMLLFATEVGIRKRVNIVPLFETIQDLHNAPEVMTTLFHNPEYHTYLVGRAGRRGLRQQVMIGYSDSSKDGGYIASNWNLYTAQQQLTKTCVEQGVNLKLFHGRGGSIGRGGGPTGRAILSQPPESLRGGIKITEQGEVIAYRYSNANIARRHLQQVMNAVLVAMGAYSENQVQPLWRDVMEQLSEIGRQTYRDFVYETEGFLDYWQQSTPINELSQLRISSRPAKRKSKGGFAAMRAIPWMFSWMQNRAIIPSWFGVGKALEMYCDEQADGLETLQTMYREWSFFKALIENTQLDVAKADMGIAELYSSLVFDDDLRKAMFTRIQTEHERTCEMICKVTGQEDLLDAQPAIQTSIERRNPYVDPLNYIQVELLRELRQLEPDTPEYQATLDAILATINGIAAGMKTTG